MRLGWIVATLLAFQGKADAGDMVAYVTVEGSASTFAAKTIASSVFQKAGISIAWRAPSPVTGTAPIWVRVELAEGTPHDRLPGALAVAYPYSGCSKSITVFCDRVRSLAPKMEREQVLLAYVLVHEITHVLQGVDQHTAAGVMKATWSAEDREAIFERRLGFSDYDVRLMRRGLAMGACHKPGALIDRSGSGSAFRPE